MIRLFGRAMRLLSALMITACASSDEIHRISQFAPPTLTACAHLLAHTGMPRPNKAVQQELYFCKAGHVGYLNPETRVADWVVELLTPARMEKHLPRKEQWHADNDLPKAYRTSYEAYTRSGYARGHLAPANDMRFSALAMGDSFAMSNIAPQLGASFNQSKWATLERLVQNWQPDRRVLVVITGTVFEGRPEVLIQNKNKPEQAKATQIWIPSHFYKIVYAPLQGEAIAFLVPHEDLRHQEVTDFRTSVDRIEDLTGYDFLGKLSDAKQSRIESGVAPMW